MEPVLKKELESASKKIGAVIADDSFPEGIEPENLRSAVRAYPMRGGKRIRPIILLWACGALEGNPGQALYAAVSVELYHNWTLVHDDIIDEDELRRGIPTTHVELKRFASAAFERSETFCEKYGRDFAILAGDIQQGWAMNMMLRSIELGVDPALLIKIMRRYQESVNRELISGEALDVEFALRDLKKISKMQIKKMIIGKTASLLRFSAQCGGAIAINSASFSSAPLSNMGAYADFLGLAFQMRDDYLDVFGTETRFGKPLCSDFKESKPTILYVETVKRLPKIAAAEFKKMLGLPHYGAEEISAIRDMICVSGAKKSILEKIEILSERAQENLDILPENKYKKLLFGLTKYLLARES